MKSSSMMGKRSIKAAEEEAQDYKETVRRYHPIVKTIYEEIKNRLGGKPLYAMPGGGGQHQVFFGNENGYIGILYLDMKNSKRNSTSYTLTSNGRHGDTILKDFKMDGIDFRTCESIYGKEWLDENYPITENN